MNKKIKTLFMIIIIFITIGILDYYFLYTLWRYGYIHWLWTCFVDICAGIFFTYVGSENGLTLVDVLKGGVGFASGILVLLVVFWLIPKVIINAFYKYIMER